MRDVASILPPNATDTERAIEAALAPQIELAPISALHDADTCPAELLSHLAWSLSVDVWDPDWPEAIKRATCRAARQVHRLKGTPASISAVLEAAGYGDARIVEGADTAVGGPWAVGEQSVSVGGPSHWAEFWVVVTRPIPPTHLIWLREIITATAPAHCRLTRIIVEAVSVAVGGAWTVGAPEVPVGATYREDMTYG